ncbi:MAG: tetratricopeptide repeat protein [Deltaproteobacteria bacterium]|nr:tetratricopeptide repeat protein [Deltaproteobacteria bacterium]
MLNKLNISQSKQKLIVYIVLTIVTFAVFWQVNQYNFINIDDNLYVTQNSHIQSGITLDGFRWAFCTRYADLWNPLVWLSFMFDYQLFGLNAGGYHVTNLILHILSTLLLFWLFCRMTGAIWKSAFVATLFALHPLHVESVAWIAERKDVLSAFFWILTLCLYVYYTEKQAIRRYLLVLFFFTCALLSKPMVVTLPVIMILLDYWPLGRFESKKDNLILWQLKEKIPFFVLSAVFSIITIYAQHDPSGKVFPLGSRIANSPVSFVTYLEKTFWPHDLAVFYPFSDQLPVWQVLGAILLILVVSATVIAAVKRLPYLLTGWFWYAITILPVIGIVQIGNHSMADRYTYLPLIGISIILAWGIPHLFPREDMRKNILFPAGIAVLAILSVITWQQCSYWKNDTTLFGHALQVTKDNYLAHGSLGPALFKEGKTEEAIDHYNKAIRIMPDYVEPYNNRGAAYAQLGQYQQAIEDYNHAIRIRPDYIPPYNNRGAAYARLGQHQRAIEDYNHAIRLKPEGADAYHNRGLAYSQLGQYQLAINDLNKAISLNHYYLMAYLNRAAIYGKFNQYHNVIKDLNETIRLQPDNALFYYNRGFAYAKISQYLSAISDLNTAIRLKEDYADAYNTRGAVYLNQRNNELGCRDAQKACQLGNCKTLDAAKGKGYCL